MTERGYCQSCKQVVEVNDEGKCSKCGEKTLDRFSESELLEKDKGVVHEAAASVPIPKAIPEPIPKRRKWRWLIWLAVGFAVVIIGGGGFLVFGEYYWGYHIPNQERKEHAGNYVNPEGKYILLESNGDYRLGEYTPGYVAGEKWEVEGGDEVFVPTDRTGRGGVYGYFYLIRGNSIVATDKVGDKHIPDTDPNSVYTKAPGTGSSSSPYPQVH